VSSDDGRGTDDAYARAFMGGDRVLFLDKVRAPWWLNAAMFLPGVVGVGVAIAVGDPVPAVVGVAAFGMAGVLAALRVAVTDSHVHVQYGPIGPKIALSDIVAVDVVDYEAIRYGGWGIRRGLTGGTAYSLPGRGGKSVRITTTKGKVVEVTSEQPAALRSAILDARSALTADLSTVREQLGVHAAPVHDVVSVDDVVEAKR